MNEDEHGVITAFVIPKVRKSKADFHLGTFTYLNMYMRKTIFLDK